MDKLRAMLAKLRRAFFKLEKEQRKAISNTLHQIAISIIVPIVIKMYNSTTLTVSTICENNSPDTWSIIALLLSAVIIEVFSILALGKGDD